MACFNKVIIMGYLAAEPELKQTPKGISVCNFVVGVQRSYYKWKKNPCDYIRVAAFGGSANFITKNFHKGDGVHICGELRNNNYVSNTGEKKYETVVVTAQITFTGVAPNRLNESNSNSGKANNKTDDKTENKATQRQESYSDSNYMSDTYSSEPEPDFEPLEEDDTGLPF